MKSFEIHLYNGQHELLETGEVAERLRVTPRRVRQLLAEQKLPSYRFGKKFLVPAAALDAFLASAFSPALDPGLNAIAVSSRGSSVTRLDLAPYIGPDHNERES